AIGPHLRPTRSAPTRTYIVHPSLRSPSHLRPGAAQDVIDPFNVHVDDSRELVDRNLAQRSVGVNQGSIVDDQIGRADGAADLIGPCIYGVRIGYVQWGQEVAWTELFGQFG